MVIGSGSSPLSYARTLQFVENTNNNFSGAIPEPTGPLYGDLTLITATVLYDRYVLKS